MPPDTSTAERIGQAQFQFSIARDHCRDCGEYHALWNYIWLTRPAGSGLAADVPILLRLLAAHCPPGARVLIAGSADFRLLALVHEATRAANPRIALADRCETPLLVCAHYADTHGFALSTRRADLVRDELGGPFDLILSHNMLMWLSADRQAATLTGFKRALGPGGKLLLVASRLIPGGAGDSEVATREYAQGMLDALAARGVPLPEAEPQFRARFERYARMRAARTGNPASPQATQDALMGCGFTILERHENAWAAGAPRPTAMFVAAVTG